MQREARRDLHFARMHLHPALEVEPHHADHVLDVEAVADARIAHVLAGGVGHLALLQVEARVRELVEVADMVVVHVGQDHVAHRPGIDAQQRQALDRAAQERALALLGHLGGEARIDDVGATRAHRQPDEIVHRHGAVVRIAADEVIAPLGLARGVAEREDLVLRQRGRHGRHPPGRGSRRYFSCLHPT
jgi:hypothetical protein